MRSTCVSRRAAGVMRSKASNGAADGRVVLKARVRAAPFERQANDALCRLVARELGLAPRQVAIAAGEGARIKRLRIAGDPRMLDAALDRLTKGSA